MAKKRKYKSIPENSCVIISKFRDHKDLLKFINSAEYQKILGELINTTVKFNGSSEYFTHP